MLSDSKKPLHFITLRSHFRWLSIALAIAMVSTLALSTPTPATAVTSLTTCIDLTTFKERISKNGTCRTPQEAIAKWRLAPSDSSLANSATTKYLNICSNKAGSSVSYQLIRPKCARHQQQNIYTRSATLPAKPEIIRVLSLSHESASLAIAADAATTVDAPIAYYTITTSKGESKKVYSWRDLTLVISGLTSSTSYTFTVSATNADGTSPLSATSQPVTTQVLVAPQPASVQVNSAPPAPPAPPAPSCANGGTTCDVGDVGPGGGTVFYVATTPFACGPTRSESCLYLEAAPALWNDGEEDPGRSWARYPYSMEAVNNSNSPETATATAIGWGYHNTRAIILQGNTEAATSAAALADSYAPSVGGVLVDDWYLPSKDELNQMCKWVRGITGDALTSLETECVGGGNNTNPGTLGFRSDWYWSSSQGISPAGGPEEAWSQPFDPGLDDPGADYWQKSRPERVRPIRAFGAFALSSVPSFALSKTAETVYLRTTPIMGYTITSSGAPITSYSISPSVSAGLTFNATTGILSGTPTETRTTTMYTITGSNSSGSTSETFILRVAEPIGEVGPGGGIIFYVATTPFACGPARASMCTYLEVAPSGWNGSGGDPSRHWSNIEESTTTVNNPATATGIGWGYSNTRAIILQGNVDPDISAAALADSYESTHNGIDFNDWYLPSIDELNQMCKWVRGQAWTSDATACDDNSGAINTGPGAEGFDNTLGFYWSSSEKTSSLVWDQNFLDPNVDNFYLAKHGEFDFVRPIRAF
jgi:hypothetical protein